ncbi:hypothetical protein [Psychrobacillus antarcticus]|uniref:hypothetical protein n=1 Tax=Psychrobacillus antarcticus TaxID=2879115 RepID=UPI0024077824|nr:hypothetical protein [Psychrobacillus antarcticus]
MSTYRHYITGSLVFGVSTGMISLLARWITGNALLSSPEALIKYGLLGSIGLSLVGALSMFFFGFISTTIREKFPDFETIGDLFQKRLNNDGYWIMTCIILLIGLDSIFVQAVGASILFDLAFNIPFTTSLFFFFLYCFIVAGIGGMKWLQRFEGFSVFFIFAAIIFIPLYFFIQEGAFSIYDGIRLYHPYLLFAKNQETYFFMITFMLIGFGRIITDASTWQRLYMIEQNKIRLTFWSTAFVLGTIPIALSSMLMIVIFEGPFHEINLLLFQLLTKMDPIFLIVVFFLFCFGTLSTTIQADLHAMTVHFIKHIRLPLKGSISDKNMKKESYIFSGSLLLLLLIATHFIQFNFIDFLFLFGHLYAAIIPVMLVIILSKDEISRLLPYSALIGCLFSITLFPDLTSLQTIWISFIISSFISILSVLLEKRSML